MATIKLISTRLRSVRNIQKITKSMKMVSAAKYSRAEKELREARIHGHGTQAFFEKAEIAKTEVKPDIEKLIIAITSDKGLCGPVHIQISKVIKAELGNTPAKTKIVCVGVKSRLLLQSAYRENIVVEVSNIGRKPTTFLDASMIALEVKALDFGVGKIIFNKFNSTVSFGVFQIPFFSPSVIQSAPRSLMFESLGSNILDSYLEFSLASLIFYSMKENACSEQASRMNAMENASKNAGEMINLLALQLNRNRQAAITRELIEIISGAAAVE